MNCYDCGNGPCTMNCSKRPKIVDKAGFITDAKVRAAYDRICEANGKLAGTRAAEAFLRLALRHPEVVLALLPAAAG